MSEESNLSDATLQESTLTCDDETPQKASESSKKATLISDENSVKKFIQGEPIIDQKNPFKPTKNKKSPSHIKIPQKYQKKKESYKNAVNSLLKSPSDELITTEDVLRQSKYVKTYIKNPDPYFVYDPSVLARLKEEEKQQKRNIINTNGTLKGAARKVETDKQIKNLYISKLPYKKCSKPNYPNLTDIKVKVGTETEPDIYVNPNEVETNVKKFDERVKKIQFNDDDDDSEDTDEQLGKSSSSEETTIVFSNKTNTNHEEDNNNKNKDADSALNTANSNSKYLGKSTVTYAESERRENNEGSFTNTISSKEFQKFLKNKGLVLAPQQILNTVTVSNSNGNSTNFQLANGFSSDKIKTQTKTNGISSSTRIITQPKSPEILKNANQLASEIGSPLTDTPKKTKKPSIFQRLLAHNIFSSRRKTTPKESVPKAQSMYDSSGIVQIQIKDKSRLPQHKRILLEEKSKQIESPRVEFNYINNLLQNSEKLSVNDEVDSVQRSRLDRPPPNREDHLSAETNSRSKVYSSHSSDLMRNLLQAKQTSHPTEGHSRPSSGALQIFRRSTSMDRHEVLKRSKASGFLSVARANNVYPSNRSTTPVGGDGGGGGGDGAPLKTSTPIRPPPNSTESQSRLRASSSTLTSSLYDAAAVRVEASESRVYISRNEFLALREKQKAQQTSDRDLYTKVFQRKPQNNENLYERLPPQRIQAADLQPIYSSPDQSGYFVRGGPQRNTFCGVNRDPNYNRNNLVMVGGPVSHSEDNFQLSHKNTIERIQPSRLSCRSTLSREEVMEKVRQFCRNSMRRNSEQSSTDPKRSNEVISACSQISPASYASVTTQQSLPRSRKPGPQVPPRIQSLRKKSLADEKPVSPVRTSAGPSAEIVDVYVNVCNTENRAPNQPTTREQKNQGRPLSPKQQLKFLPLEKQTNGLPLVNRTQLEPTSCSSLQAISRLSSENDVRRKNIPQLRKPTGYASLLYSPLHLTSLGGRSTPLILERSHNLQSQIYRPRGPRGGGTVVQGTKLQNQLLHQANPRYGQYFSGSLNLHTSDLKPEVEVHPEPLKQPLKIHPFEQHSSKTQLEDVGCQKIEEEDWQNENKSGRQQANEQAVNDDRRRSSRREDPRRHTLGGDMLQQYGVMQGHQGQPPPQQRAMDLEAQPVRSYAPVNQGPLFDEDPGIMSEVETASTGFRRGGKQRSSLPVVRTPSKTLERPLGLVFLQYRSETKRALLPNEITSIDTVRALFVRSFPRQLTMSYLEGPNVKIYIHDASKDMFYELEDVRSHLREIRDRSVLRLFESNEVAAPPQVLPGGPGIPQPLPQAVPMQWDQDQSYFSEPEFDSEYQHQHIHKSKPGKQPPYYVGTSQTLPRGMYSDRTKVPMGAPAKPLRSYGSRGNMGPIFPYPPDQLYSIPDGYTSSPERGTRGSYEEPYYSQYGTRGNVVAPIIDEENSEVAITEDQYALYGMKMGPGRIPRTANQMYDPTRPEDLHRIRVEHMERQLANLTGLVQKALVNQNPQIAPAAVPILNPGYLGVPPQQCRERDRLKPPPPPKPIALTQTHTSYRADIALAPEVYNHLRGLQKKAKDLRMEVRTLRRLSQAQAVAVREDIKDAFMRIRATLLASSDNFWDQQGDQERTRISREEELYKQEIIRLEKDLSDLESSVEGLRGEVINRRTRVNMAAVEDMALVLSRASKTVAELKLRFPGLSNGMRNLISSEMEKVVREEKFLKEEPDRLESALRRCKKLTGTLVTLKRLASVQEQRLPPNEPPTSEDPPCSAEITTANKQPVPTPRMGTITVSGGVPPENALDALLDELQTFAKPIHQHNEHRPDDSTSDDSSQMVLSTVTTQIPQACLYNPSDSHVTTAHDQHDQPKAAAANPLINKLSNSNMLQVNANIGSLRRLHSYPSGSDTDTSPPQPLRLPGKPPVPERNADLLSKVSGKRIPPPPPPRTSSRSPLASPTSPNVPHRMPSLSETEPLMGNGAAVGAIQDGSGNSSGNESGNDQVQRQVALERRHQELLRKQKMLQEQYQRLQQMSKMPAVATMPPIPTEIIQLKKTGSESNLPKKMDLSIANVSGSMKNLNSEAIVCSAGSVTEKNEKNIQLVKQQLMDASKASSAGCTQQMPLGEGVGGGPGTIGSGTTTATTNTTTTTIKQVYETEIL